MGGKLKYGGMAVGVLAHYGIFAVTVLPYWATSTWQISNPLYGRIPTYDGIWWQCMSPKQGGFTCNNYGKPSLYVSSGLQMCRGLMCVACFTSFAGMIGSILILDCSNMLDSDLRAKRILSIVSGLSFVLAGVCTLISTSWYAWRITYEYYSPYYQERQFKYTFGPCLYTGWLVMTMAFIAGGLIAIDCSKKEDEDDDEKFTYKPPVTQTATYVPVQTKTDEEVPTSRSEYV